jgi:hypothetical protein
MTARLARRSSTDTARQLPVLSYLNQRRNKHIRINYQPSHAAMLSLTIALPQEFPQKISAKNEFR